MPTFLNYPFDAELFDYNWKQEKDPVLTAMLESGALVKNPEIENLISNGSDTYTIPFYHVLGGEEDNYDGVSNINVTTPTADAQSGIVYGRAHGWKEQDFVVDYNSGADPMKQITSQVAKFWAKKRQARMIGIVDALFKSSDTDFAGHTTDLSVSSSVADTNRIAETTIGEAAVKALGDASKDFALAVMHSSIALRLEKLNVLTFRKYTDINGMTRSMNIADINGLTVIVDDGVTNTTGAGAKATTYLFGLGALHYAEAPVKTPSELVRDAYTAGGSTSLVTRIRETIHPNGFSFTKPSSGYTSSPTNAQLFADANWARKMDPKNIAIARVITNI